MRSREGRANDEPRFDPKGGGLGSVSFSGLDAVFARHLLRAFCFRVGVVGFLKPINSFWRSPYRRGRW
jgi:hypothetical protein